MRFFLVLFVALPFLMLMAEAAKLSVVEVLTNSSPGVSGLLGAYDVKITSDGRFVYVSSDGDNTTVVFSRDAPTGKLTFVQMYTHSFHALNCYLSPDDLYLYTAGAVYHTAMPGYITVFQRDTTTGRISPIQQLNQGLSGYGLILSGSPDGSFLYMGMGSAIAVFRRNRFSGQLTLLEAFTTPGDAGYAVVATADHLYSAGDQGVMAFNRSQTNGLLVPIQTLLNGSPGADWISVYGDQGQTVVIGAYYPSGGLTTFQRSPTTGLLRFKQLITNQQVRDMSSVAVVLVSQSGDYMFVGGNVLDVLNVNPTTGDLSPSTIPSDATGSGGIGLVQFEKFLYYVCDGSSSLVVYSWEE